MKEVSSSLQVSVLLVTPREAPAMRALCGIALAAVWQACSGAVLDFGALGGVAGDDSTATALLNMKLLNETLNALGRGNELVIPAGRSFTTMGGLLAVNLTDVTLRIDGELHFSSDVSAWPVRGSRVMECLQLLSPVNVTITSSSKRGKLNGNGRVWWWFPLLGYLKHAENRPRMLSIKNGTQVLIEKLLFLDPPYWTTDLQVRGLEIRDCEISARRTDADGHSLMDLSAFNTDGFDVRGRDIWIHDVQVYSQDDCITIKDDTQNVLVERVNASGIGLVIGSIGSTTVRNITFRDSILHNSHKGIYLKFRHGSGGLIEDVLFERIVLDNIEQYPIWIGPAQQSDSKDLCYANPCSLCWPTIPGAVCHGMPSTYRNIVLRDVAIRNPQGATGVVLADGGSPVEGITFDNVRVSYCQDTSTFAETFSRLPTGIHDGYVTEFIALLVLLLLLLVAAPCGLCCWKGVCTRPFWQRRDKRVRWGCRVFCGTLLVFLLLTAGWFTYLAVWTGNDEAYLLCEGVVNATALGDTWPVPQCFEDRTGGAAPSPKCGLSGGAKAGVALAVLAGLAGALALVLLALKRKSPDRYAGLVAKLRPRKSSPTSPDASTPADADVQEEDPKAAAVEQATPSAGAL